VGGRYSSTPSEPPWLDGEPELEPGSGREIESWIDGERTSGIGWVERRPGGKVRALGVARMPSVVVAAGVSTSMEIEEVRISMVASRRSW
jgi:hypothetical protein